MGPPLCCHEVTSTTWFHSFHASQLVVFPFVSIEYFVCVITNLIRGVRSTEVRRAIARGFKKKEDRYDYKFSGWPGIHSDGCKAGNVSFRYRGGIRGEHRHKDPSTWSCSWGSLWFHFRTNWWHTSIMSEALSPKSCVWELPQNYKSRDARPNPRL